jgi:predicted dehydrogenase
MDKVRLGIVGAGFMAQAAHVHCFQLAQDCEVVALASGRPKLREQVARRFNIPVQYDSWAQLATAPDIDAAAVLLPPEYNPDVVCGLLEAGKHVFAEKPMALSLKQAERMAAAAQRNDRLLMIAFMKRYDTGIERARKFWDEVVAQGGMGDLICGRAWCLLGGNWTANQHLVVPILRSDEPQSPKPMADLGPDWLPESLRQGMPSFASPYYAFNHVHSHNVNLLRYFLGNDWEVTYADFRHRTKIAHLRFGDALVHIEVGSGTSAYAFEEGMKLYFSRGWMEIIPPPPMLMQGAAQVRVYRDSEMMELSQPMGDWDWAFRRQAQHFVDCILSRSQLRSSGADGVHDLRLVEDIFRKAVEIGNV